MSYFATSVKCFDFDGNVQRSKVINSTVLATCSVSVRLRIVVYGVRSKVHDWIKAVELYSPGQFCDVDIADLNF